MKRVLALFLSVASLGVYAQAPAESEDVMLQGFYWNSQRQTGWTQLTDQAADIAKSFNLIWLPPSASAEGGGAVGGNNMGYHPPTVEQSDIVLGHGRTTQDAHQYTA